MQKYKNLGHNSNVYAFEAGAGYIWVVFNDGGRYLYNNSCPGPNHVNNMIRLAYQGQGLNSYIGRVVKKNYARKVA